MGWNFPPLAYWSSKQWYKGNRGICNNSKFFIHSKVDNSYYHYEEGCFFLPIGKDLFAGVVVSSPESANYYNVTFPSYNKQIIFIMDGNGQIINFYDIIGGSYDYYNSWVEVTDIQPIPNSNDFLLGAYCRVSNIGTPNSLFGRSISPGSLVVAVARISPSGTFVWKQYSDNLYLGEESSLWFTQTAFSYVMEPQRKVGFTFTAGNPIAMRWENGYSSTKYLDTNSFVSTIFDVDTGNIESEQHIFARYIGEWNFFSNFILTNFFKSNSTTGVISIPANNNIKLLPANLYCYMAVFTSTNTSYTPPSTLGSNNEFQLFETVEATDSSGKKNRIAVYFWKKTTPGPWPAFTATYPVNNIEYVYFFENLSLGASPNYDAYPVYSAFFEKAKGFRDASSSSPLSLEYSWGPFTWDYPINSGKLCLCFTFSIATSSVSNPFSIPVYPTSQNVVVGTSNVWKGTTFSLSSVPVLSTGQGVNLAGSCSGHASIRICFLRPFIFSGIAPNNVANSLAIANNQIQHVQAFYKTDNFLVHLINLEPNQPWTEYRVQFYRNSVHLARIPSNGIPFIKEPHSQFQPYVGSTFFAWANNTLYMVAFVYDYSSNYTYDSSNNILYNGTNILTVDPITFQYYKFLDLFSSNPRYGIDYIAPLTSNGIVVKFEPSYNSFPYTFPTPLYYAPISFYTGMNSKMEDIGKYGYHNQNLETHSISLLYIENNNIVRAAAFSADKSVESYDLFFLRWTHNARSWWDADNKIFGWGFAGKSDYGNVKVSSGPEAIGINDEIVIEPSTPGEQLKWHGTMWWEVK